MGGIFFYPIKVVLSIRLQNQPASLNRRGGQQMTPHIHIQSKVKSVIVLLTMLLYNVGKKNPERCFIEI